MLLHNFLHQMMNFLLNNIYAYLFIVKKSHQPFFGEWKTRRISANWIAGFMLMSRNL